MLLGSKHTTVAMGKQEGVLRLVCMLLYNQSDKVVLSRA
jgi:hypothetical protein